jgi:uroporphyrin-III C-methyltransferase
MPQSVDWGAIATAAPVIVMFMAVKHLGAIAEKLIAAGRDPGDRLAIVSHAALPEQAVLETTLGGVASLGDEIPTPAIVVLGPVNAYRDTLDWYLGDLRNNTIG